MVFKRRKTRQINVGGVKIGGNAPVVVQTMTKTDTRDTEKTIEQIKQITKSGGEIVRLAILDMQAVEAFKIIASKAKIPLVADIHFDYRLAIKCVENGASKIRFNPGNIGSIENVKKLVAVCKKVKVPIRIGVNSGSLEAFVDIKPANKGVNPLVQKKNKIIANNHYSTNKNNPLVQGTELALVESALKHVRILENEDFYDICISAKSTDPQITIKANEILSEKTNYPLHLGVTEAGLGIPAVAKSASALSALLSKGIGDTIRISLTDEPTEEIKIAQEILQSLGIRKFNRNFISCPGCGRTEIAIHKKVAKEVFDKTINFPANLIIAVMGCEVNGPGEAKNADFALVQGKNFYSIYQKGKFLKNIEKEKAIKEFLKILK